MAVWKAYRITEILNDIEDGKYVLPVIQRRLVWEEDKMIQLFDTLLKGDSFGGIMVIQEEKGKSPLFNFRPFTKDGSRIDSREIKTLNQTQYFVIDGQQRLQSFYIGLKGTLNGKVLYFDLFSNYKKQFEFCFEVDSKKLAIQPKDTSERTISEHNWHLVETLLTRLKDTNDEDEVAAEIIEDQSITDEYHKEHIKRNVKAFYKNVVTSEAIGISKVSLNKELDNKGNKQRIVELFRRLNDGGTRLSAFDLVASILKGFNWKMEEFLESTLEDYKDLGLTQDNLIKLIFLLRDNPVKEMTDIEEDDATFAIDNHERITSVLVATRKFLIESGLHNYYKDGNRSFIPLYFIAYHLYHKSIDNAALQNYFNNHDASNTDFPLMKKWMYYSLLNGVFRSRGAGWIAYSTGVKKILNVIKSHKGQVFPLQVLFSVYYNHGITFTEDIEVSKIESFESQFLYYLMYDRRQVIRIQDTDHIMPKNILEGKYEWNEINSIANFQLIDYGTNRGEKNGKPFQEWIQNFVQDKANYITKHLIPVDESTWKESQFEIFSKERANLIFEKIEKYVIKNN
ncbi:GmrSD restriction endonuclease domain-containing protein [Chitinophaga caseinilytica]|uniref:DUF262 domain-containing protein n=1 Tax=Chitinophaga caseinilytica TaxID=2267521 RepID=A0ABZ2Z4R8_9BACT